MAQKSIYIGLGGAGVWTVGHLKAKLLEECGRDNAALARRCRFLVIDTSDRDLSQVDELYRVRLGRDRVFDQSEMRDLGDVNPLAVYDHIAHKVPAERSEDEAHLLGWVDQTGVAEFDDRNLRYGAAANRQMARIAIWQHWQEIWTAVDGAILGLTSPGQGENERAGLDDLTFYIASGTCGGTGSASFIDIAFLIHRLIRSHGGEAAGIPNIFAILYMPQLFLDIYQARGADRAVLDRYRANAFAFFEELDGLLLDRWDGEGRNFGPAAVRRGLGDAEQLFAPFRIAFLIDQQTDRGSALTQEQLYSNTAELLTYWNRDEVRGTFLADLVNSITETCKNTRPDGHVPACARVGYRALRFPDALLTRYFETRFEYELATFGLLGARFPAALSQAKAESLQHQVYDQHVLRYLFSSARAEGVLNLEAVRSTEADRQLASLSLARFTDANGRIEINRARDVSLLVLLRDDANALAIKLEREFAGAFELGPTSHQALVTAVVDGAEGDHGVPLGLVDEIENLVLRHGLLFAEDVVTRLDVMCVATISKSSEPASLAARERAANERLRSLVDVEIPRCCDGTRLAELGKKDVVTNLHSLHASLQEWIRVRANLVILNQQRRILEALCQGDRGILDGWARGLAELANAVTQELSNPTDPDRGLRGAYTSGLQKKFAETESDVTTVYLPNVADYVQGGGWADTHLFQGLFEEVVPRAPDSPKRDPLRQGDGPGEEVATDGLFAILRDLLTSTEVTGRERGFSNGVSVAFFRRTFAGGVDPIPAGKLVQELLVLGRTYISGALDRGRVAEVRATSLLKRFDQLESAPQSLIAKRFTDAETHTFCKMVGDGSGSVTTLYLAADVAVAKALGFDANDKSQKFVSDGNLTDRAVKVKVVGDQVLCRYTSWSAVKESYELTRAARLARGGAFAPHLHALFNRQGVSAGLASLAARNPETRTRALALCLLYREVFALAGKDPKGTALLDGLLDLDSGYRGLEERLDCPVQMWEEDRFGRKLRRLDVVSRVESLADGRVRLLRKHLGRVSDDVASYAKLAADAAETQTPWVAGIRHFRTAFLRRAGREWADGVEGARAVLVIKLDAASKSLPQHKAVNDALINAVNEAATELATALRARAMAPAAVTPPAGAEARLETI